MCSIPGFQAHVSCLVPWALSFDQEKPLERALLVQHYYASCACKTHVFVSVCSQVMKGRGGVGGHVNVPCTISATCCYAAQMSGSVAAHEGVGWWGGHVNVPCTSSATCCYAAQMSGSVASLYTSWGGVGGAC